MTLSNRRARSRAEDLRAGRGLLGRLGTYEHEFLAFQPFFVEHAPPRVLTEGDEISLPVVLRNYLGRAQGVDVELKPESWPSSPRCASWYDEKADVG